MTDSTKPEASAVVTREHREEAVQALAYYDADWLSGRGCNHALDTLAQAIANAEARSRASRDEEVERLLNGFLRWKRGDLNTEEFEGLFYELDYQRTAALAGRGVR